MLGYAAVQRLLAWWWLLVPAVALFELARGWQIDGDVPTSASWAAAAATIQSGFADGDLVVVAPAWAAQVARVHLGERLQRLEDVARADTTRYGRLWVVSIRGARAPEERGGRLEQTVRHGQVTVRRFALPRPARVHFDFVQELHEARVEMLRKTGTTPCPWERAARGIGGGRFRCDRTGGARRDWNHVGAEVLDDLHRRPHLAIWAHPARAAKIAIEWGDVPLGERLAGYTGLRYEAAKRMAHGPVRLQVTVGDRSHGPFVERDGDGWKAFSVDTRRFAGQRARVRFEVDARDPSMRHFYFAADTRSGGPR